MKYRAVTTSAITSTISITVPAFLVIFTFFSRNLTKGFAINAIIAAITKGIKYISTLGSIHKKNTMESTIRAILIDILKYFVDFFIDIISPGL